MSIQFKECGAITGGAFIPENIIENWDTDTGPIAITFELENKEYQLEPNYLDDYLDMELLEEINQIMPKVQIKFELLKAFDQTAFVLWLSKKTINALIQRGWEFSW